MTVSAAYAPLLFNGNDVTVDLPVTWPFFTGSLVVTAIDAVGVETVKTISTHYTVAGGTTAAGLPSTGTVTMLTAPATGTQTRVERATALTQATGYNTNDAFPAKTVEGAFDKGTLIEQELGDDIGRAVKVSLRAVAQPELPYDVENKLLIGQADGTLAVMDLDAGSGLLRLNSSGRIEISTTENAAQMAANTIKLNNTGVTANAIDGTTTQATAMLNAVVGDAGSGGTKGLVPAPAAGDAALGRVLRADGAWGNAAGYKFIGGLRLSNNVGTPNTKIDIAAGSCVDSTNAYLLTSAAVTINCATTGALGLDTGSLANNTWYHVHIIGKTDGTVSAIASTSPTTPTFPSGYTLLRRIGSFRTNGSAQIIAFSQKGDTFQWLVPVADVNAANPGTAAVTRTLTVPTGVQVEAIVQVVGNGVNAGTDSPGGISITDLATTDTAASLSNSSVQAYSSAATQLAVGATCRVFTNTSAQVRSRVQISTAGTTLYINTVGWVDSRGRDA